jgi:hypothetical protein
MVNICSSASTEQSTNNTTPTSTSSSTSTSTPTTVELASPRVAMQSPGLMLDSYYGGRSPNATSSSSSSSFSLHDVINQRHHQQQHTNNNNNNNSNNNSSNSINTSSNTWSPVLIFIPMQLGVDKLNPRYERQIAALLRIEQVLSTDGPFVSFIHRIVSDRNPHRASAWASSPASQVARTTSSAHRPTPCSHSIRTSCSRLRRSEGRAIISSAAHHHRRRQRRAVTVAAIRTTPICTTTSTSRRRRRMPTSLIRRRRRRRITGLYSYVAVCDLFL